LFRSRGELLWMLITTSTNPTGKYGAIRPGSKCKVFSEKEQSLMRELHFSGFVRATRAQTGS
jgi:hypothetical protein